ncbi:redoxin domain-containing protein [Candidatus Bathyarchaeota archaeon]|nr:redoxin domain-containing protein [Candidatus Bathyarchaeota archaeon]
MVNKLSIGDSAPDFTRNAINLGHEITLSEILKEKPVLLIFSRYFGCPVCQSDFDKLQENLESINEKVQVIYVTQSREETIKDFIKNMDISFPIISDPESPYPLYEMYKIGRVNLLTLAKMGKTVITTKYKHGPHEGYEKQSPADFIIDRDGKIIHRNYSLFNMKKIRKALENL